MKSIFTEGEPVTLLVLPGIQSMLTGVSQIEIAHPRYRLTYTDGTHEEANLGLAERPDRDNEPFSIISAVQEEARKDQP